MKLSRNRGSHSLPMNMTPMIDVVFQLLIFFMICSQTSDTSKERIELPVQPGTVNQQQALLTFHVNAGGQISSDGKDLSVDDVVRLADSALSRVKDDPQQVQVTLRIDRHSQCRPVNDIVTQLNRLQIRRVRIAVHVPE